MVTDRIKFVKNKESTWHFANREIMGDFGGSGNLGMSISGNKKEAKISENRIKRLKTNSDHIAEKDFYNRYI